jgi:PAS domain S-box-containing protein
MVLSSSALSVVEGGLFMKLSVPLAVSLTDASEGLGISQLILDNAADAIFLLDSAGRTTVANPAAEEMFGWSGAELHGKKLHDVIHYRRPDGSPFPMSECPLGHVFSTGESLKLHEDTFFHKDGSPIPVACSNAAIQRGGETVGGVLIVRDVSGRREAEERLQLLMGELEHRVRNTLAVVQGLVRQSLAGDDINIAREKVEARLSALAASHQILTSVGWTTASVRSIVHAAISPLCPKERLTSAGPEAELAPHAALSLSLCLHELATNATKYGALANASGVIEVSWVILASPVDTLHMVWEESGGPPVRSPGKKGFGSRLIERSARADLGGSARLEFKPEGLRCELDFPLVPWAS